jgi:outer membrane protein OmpA-like peptidoglycan-associated protein
MEDKMIRKFMLFVAVVLLASFQFNCATKKHVKKEVQRIDTEMQGIESSVEANQTRLKEHDTQISNLSRETQEAMQRAQSAEKLAQGKLLYEVTLTDEDVRFGFNRAEVTEKGREVLDNLLNQLKSENKNVYIEVQGHTDNKGSDDYNMKLGEQRADSVRRYMSENGIPLHRISTISYGESRPIASNKTKDGRSQNRRVVIVVLE